MRLRPAPVEPAPRMKFAGVRPVSPVLPRAACSLERLNHSTLPSASATFPYRKCILFRKAGPILLEKLVPKETNGDPLAGALRYGMVGGFALPPRLWSPVRNIRGWVS